MKIVDLKARPVAVPIEAPIRHSTGVHPYFQRTILQLATDEGIVGLGEVGGTGDWRSAAEKVKPRLLGEDPYNLERIRQKILRPSYYVSNARLYAAVEMACLDIQGKATGRAVADLIGGRLRDRIPFSAYLFYRYREGDVGGETSPEEMSGHARRLVEQYGFRSVKLKCGFLPPDHDVDTLHALRAELGPKMGLRIDPNGAWSRGTAIRVAKAIEDCGPEYYEDPTWGLEGMARVRERTSLPLATNMCVTNFDQIAPAVAMNAVDIILTDVYYWEGIRGVKALGTICDCFRWGVSMHSGVELGVTLAAMLHAAASLPNMTYDADAHYHHLLDDILVGGKMKYEQGSIAVPKGPGLGVELDEDRMGRYEEFFQKKGDYLGRYMEDPRRPDWFPINPAY
jgi:glucarate dehydratase